MKFHTLIPLIALVGLVACGETSEPEVTSAEVIALAEEAAWEADSDLPDALDEPAVSPDFLADAVPMQSADEPEPEAEVPEPIATASFRLRHGETLHYFAKWSELPVEVIAEASGLDLAGDYPVGTEVAIPSDGIDVAAVESARDAHWKTRIDGYMAGRGGEAGTDFYTVATGDTAWGIAREAHGIPIWLLAAYNPQTALDSLRPGDKLMVPILADIVVDAEDADPAPASDDTASE